MAPSSVSSAPTVDYSPTSLPLFKLSHCTTTTPRSNMLWTHLPNRDDMFAVFDQLRRMNFDGSIVEMKVLKLVRAGELLEQIELDTLQHQMRMDEERARSQMINDDNLCVLVIVKKPLLALRYQLADGNIRKIQMNFQPASGCDVALNRFKSVGLPVRDRDKVAQPKSQMRLPSSQGAPPSSQPPSQEATKPFIAAYNQLEQATSAAIPILSQPRSMQQLGTWNNANYDSIPPPSAQSTRIPTPRVNLVRDGMTEDEFSKPITFIHDPRSRINIIPDGYNVRSNLNRPSSSSAIFETRSHAQAIPTRLLPNLDSQVSTFDSYDTRPTSAPETESARFLMGSLPISQMLPPKRELPFPVKAEKPPSQNTPASNAPAVENVLGKVSKPKATISKATARKKPGPKAAIESLVAQDSLGGKTSKLICPDCGRNDFKGSNMGFLLHCNSQHDRNFSSTEAAIQASVQGHGAGMGTGVSTDQVSEPGKLDQIPSSSAPNPQGKKAASKKRILDTPPSSSAPPKIDTARRPSPKIASPIDKFLANTQKPKKNPRKRSKTALQNSNSNKPPAQESNEDGQPTTKEQPAQAGPSFPSITPAEYLDSLDGWIRKYHNLPALKAPQTAKEQLAEYAKQNDEDRAKAIDNMICDCLEDENFIKLVEDVEGAWRRIGLGF